MLSSLPATHEADLVHRKARIDKKARIRRIIGKKLIKLSTSAALLIMLGVATLGQVHAAQAVGVGVLTWDPGMIYAGQNNGNPMGPVGENALIHGSYLPNVKLKLKIVHGDASKDPQKCLLPGIAIRSTVTDSAGTIGENFLWPSSANQVGGEYSVCASTLDGIPHAATTPFKVLSAHAPTLTLSSPTVAPGGTITVTGRYWVPAQPISINIADCVPCNPGQPELVVGQANSAGMYTGTFSATLTIPASATSKRYVVDATSDNALIQAYYTGSAKYLQVAPFQPTPTPTVATTPTPDANATATAAAATTPTAAAVTNTTPAPTDTGSSGGNPLLLIGLIVGLLLLVAAIGVIIYYALKQRRDKASQAPPSGLPGPGYRPTGQASMSMPPGQYPNYPASMPVSNGQPQAFQQAASQPQAWRPAEAPGQVRFGPGIAPAQSTPQSNNWSQPAAPYGGQPDLASQSSWVTQASANNVGSQAPGMNTVFDPSLGRPQAGSNQTFNRVSNASETCPQCGKPLSPDEAFCGHCGAKRGSQVPWSPGR